MLNIGQMDAKIDILKLKESTGPIRNLNDKDRWENHLSQIWAKAEFPKGREVWQAKAANAVTLANFIIRKRPGITSSMAVKYGGTIYKIESVSPLEKTSKDYLMLTCGEVTTIGS